LNKRASSNHRSIGRLFEEKNEKSDLFCGGGEAVMYKETKRVSPVSISDAKPTIGLWCVDIANSAAAEPGNLSTHGSLLFLFPPK
jgi:hypothetical protein